MMNRPMVNSPGDEPSYEEPSGDKRPRIQICTYGAVSCNRIQQLLMLLSSSLGKKYASLQNSCFNTSTHDT